MFIQFFLFVAIKLNLNELKAAYFCVASVLPLKMALNAEKVKLLNYFCGVGDDASASEKINLEVKNWFETQADRRVVLFKDRDEKTIGGRIDLRWKLCLQYFETGYCYPPHYCPHWHVCKRFIEGDCDGTCGLSHNFHDEDNGGKMAEVGLSQKFPIYLIRNIVAYSLPQICLLYLKSECKTEGECPYLHICSSAIRKIACECSLSHNLEDQHNEKILDRYNLSHSIWFTSERRVDFVRCNVLVPVQQKVQPSTELSSVDECQLMSAMLKMMARKPSCCYLTSPESKRIPLQEEELYSSRWGSNSSQDSKSMHGVLALKGFASISPNPGVNSKHTMSTLSLLQSNLTLKRQLSLTPAKLRREDWMKQVRKEADSLQGDQKGKTPATTSRSKDIQKGNR